MATMASFDFGVKQIYKHASEFEDDCHYALWLWYDTLTSIKTKRNYLGKRAQKLNEYFFEYSRSYNRME